MPSRITGALKLMLGRFGGGWKEAGSPLGRLACVAELTCWTPGGGAIPGAEDMPGGGPVDVPSAEHSIEAVAIERVCWQRQTYLDREEGPCLARRLSRERH